MADPPLDPRGDPELARRFLDHFGLCGDASPRERLRSVAAAFSRLPYENLTKIIKQAEHGAPRAARRLPREVLADHLACGAGGTCFSLTAALLQIVRALGWAAEPLLADRRYGADTHCGLTIWIDGRPHLLDPGYLILDPIPLDADGPTRVRTEFNELLLSPTADGRGLELATVDRGQTKYRLTFKTTPADCGQFLCAWDASFAWDMMRYPVLSQVRAGRQLYLQGRRFQTRDRDAVRRHELQTAELDAQIARAFGIAPQVVARALEILRRQGEHHG